MKQIELAIALAVCALMMSSVYADEDKSGGLGANHTIADGENQVTDIQGIYYINPSEPTHKYLADSIQQAIDRVDENGLVRVPPGEFKENLVISRPVSITGAGADQSTLNGDGKDHVIYVRNYDIAVTLTGLSIINGKADDGGGIYNYGNLVLDQCKMLDNKADDDGGAVYNDGTLTIADGDMNRNSAVDEGGAIYNDDELNIYRVWMFQNVAGYGGGVYDDGKFNLEGGGIFANAAKYGGGVYVSAGSEINLVGDTAGISGNYAEYGGGIFNHRGYVTLDKGTVEANQAIVKNGGGGIYSVYCFTTSISGNKSIVHDNINGDFEDHWLPIGVKGNESVAVNSSTALIPIEPAEDRHDHVVGNPRVPSDGLIPEG